MEYPFKLVKKKLGYTLEVVLCGISCQRERKKKAKDKRKNKRQKEAKDEEKQKLEGNQKLRVEMRCAP